MSQLEKKLIAAIRRQAEDAVIAGLVREHAEDRPYAKYLVETAEKAVSVSLPKERENNDRTG